MAEESGDLLRCRFKDGYRVDARENRLSFYQSSASGEAEISRFSLPHAIAKLTIADEKHFLVKIELTNGTIGWGCPSNSRVTPFYTPSLLSSVGFRRMVGPFMQWVAGEKVDTLVREMPSYQHAQFRDLIERGVEPVEPDRPKELLAFLRDLGAMIGAEIRRMEQRDA